MAVIVRRGAEMVSDSGNGIGVSVKVRSASPILKVRPDLTYMGFEKT
jgi:hypothetical protein